MTTGEKIKKLRAEKMMTQSQLVGDQITRNMLSRIESDEANPSLGTLIYLAKRLNVPAGYLLASEKEDELYKKSFALDGIKLAYKSGSYKICRQLCMDYDGFDDEIVMIAANASFYLAVEEFDKGNLKRAVTYFDEAISYDLQTSYYTEHVKAASCMYLRYMARFSQNLSSSVIDENSVEYFCAMNNDFCRYIYAIECVENSQTTFASTLVSNGEREDPTILHLGARLDMMYGNYRLAIIKLQQALNNNRAISRPVLYCVFSDLEECAKATNDFRGAYEYSTTKMDLLQKMLSDE